MAQQGLITRQVREVDISTLTITSNDKKNIKDIVDAVTDVYYYESILQQSLRASVLYVDTGKSIKTEKGAKTILEGLPIVGQENVSLIIKDANDVKLDLKLYVNNTSPAKQDTTKSLVGLDVSPFDLPKPNAHLLKPPFGLAVLPFDLRKSFAHLLQAFKVSSDFFIFLFITKPPY